MNLQTVLMCFMFACVSAIQPDLTINLQSGSVSPSSLPTGFSWRSYPSSSFSSVSSSSCNLQGVLKATFNTANRRRLEIDLEYDRSTVSGYTLNVGDSITNDGHAGDGFTQSNDAELQITGDTLTMYSADHPTNRWGLLRTQSGFVTKGTRVIINVSDGKVTADNGSQSVVVQSFRLFALNGQPDLEGPVNYDVYVGFNRVISTRSTRTGSGLCKAHLTWHSQV